MLLLAPRSTLFPYTTLFRSGEEVTARVALLEEGHHPRREHRVADRLLDLRRGFTRIQFMRQHPQAITQVRRHQDRKSTRLNSSHLGISYAVFCLKKKINQNY